MEKEKEILRNLIAERVELKVTQQEMARRTGMSQQAISRLELLEHEPSLKRFLSYAEALGYDLQLVKKEKQPDQNTLSEKASDDNKTKKTEQSKLNKFESAESTSNECNQALLKKPLPVGVSSFKDVCDGYYYVDKTLLIKDFLDERPKVTLFTRPRRFGKSLTMDMLRTFFEHTKADTSAYFKDKKIWQQGQRYRDHQGKYPVIFISFKDAGKDSWEHTLDYIIQLIRTEYRRHSELAGSDRISDRDFYEAVIKDTLKPELYDYSLFMLSRMLHEHFGIAPVLIIDEYDTPLQQGFSKGYYDNAVEFMRNLFSAALKDNEHLSFGFMTGILRIAKESIFSGLNNLKVDAIIDQKYSEYFGFTYSEVEAMTAYYCRKMDSSDPIKDDISLGQRKEIVSADQKDLTALSSRQEEPSTDHHMKEICEWYDGYLFGETEIFNPWSVINYFSNDLKPRPFWENTGKNTIIGDILDRADRETCSQLSELMQGNTITTIIDSEVTYPDIYANPSVIYSFLLAAGYLKISEINMTPAGFFLCKVSIPNKEIACVYKREILSKLGNSLTPSAAAEITKALYQGNVGLLQKKLRQFLLESTSYLDLTTENAYHMLLLGLCAMMSDHYRISSNRESGEGRFDIQLMPIGPTPKEMPGIIIELKSDKNDKGQSLETLATQALAQIDARHYDTEMKKAHINKILKYGVAFGGKKVYVVMREET